MNIKDHNKRHISDALQALHGLFNDVAGTGVADLVPSEDLKEADELARDENDVEEALNLPGFLYGLYDYGGVFFHCSELYLNATEAH